MRLVGHLFDSYLHHEGLTMSAVPDTSAAALVGTQVTATVTSATPAATPSVGATLLAALFSGAGASAVTILEQLGDSLLDKAGEYTGTFVKGKAQSLVATYLPDASPADQQYLIDWVVSDPRVALIFAKLFIHRAEAKLNARLTAGGK